MAAVLQQHDEHLVSEANESTMSQWRQTQGSEIPNLANDNSFHSFAFNHASPLPSSS